MRGVRQTPRLHPLRAGRVILLDTNIISEALRPSGNPAVLAWLDAQAVETLYLSTITLAELRFGIAAMPAGRRRTILARELDQRVLPFLTDAFCRSIVRPRMPMGSCAGEPGPKAGPSERRMDTSRESPPPTTWPSPRGMSGRLRRHTFGSSHPNTGDVRLRRGVTVLVVRSAAQPAFGMHRTFAFAGSRRFGRRSPRA